MALVCNFIFHQYLQETLGDFVQSVYEFEDDCEVRSCAIHGQLQIWCLVQVVQISINC